MGNGRPYALGPRTASPGLRELSRKKLRPRVQLLRSLLGIRSLWLTFRFTSHSGSFLRLSLTHLRKSLKNYRDRFPGCKPGLTRYMQGQHAWQPASIGNSVRKNTLTNNQMPLMFRPQLKNPTKKWTPVRM